ncbi:hypothetical protein ACOJVU_01635 [Mycobacterium sp. THU-M104]|uniref:hypothetical protein n=1 Tax=Mycobacterium sp. THU-M104 TaxID=3410515 RepID=UPI003B9C3D6E
MEEAESDPARRRDAEGGPPLTVDALADMQAGLLGSEDAARLRRRVRADQRAQGVLRALNRVRRDVAAVASDPVSAPEPPPGVTARVSAALRSAGPPSGCSPGPAHFARPRIRPARVIAVSAGFAATLAGIGLGTAALIHAPASTPSTEVTAEHITVSALPMAIPLSRSEILDLLDRGPDYGPLRDPQRRASCLTGLGYQASAQVLGARPVQINARAGVLLVLAGDTPGSLAVFAVAPSCSAADTGLLADTQVPRA